MAVLPLDSDQLQGDEKASQFDYNREKALAQSTGI